LFILFKIISFIFNITYIIYNNNININKLKKKKKKRYGLTIAMLIWGVYLALETSNLPEQFNEGKYINNKYLLSLLLKTFIKNNI